RLAGGVDGRSGDGGTEACTDVRCAHPVVVERARDVDRPPSLAETVEIAIGPGIEECVLGIEGVVESEVEEAGLLRRRVRARVIAAGRQKGVGAARSAG